MRQNVAAIVVLAAILIAPASSAGADAKAVVKDGHLQLVRGSESRDIAPGESLFEDDRLRTSEATITLINVKNTFLQLSASSLRITNAGVLLEYGSAILYYAAEDATAIPVRTSTAGGIRITPPVLPLRCCIVRVSFEVQPNVTRVCRVYGPAVVSAEGLDGALKKLDPCAEFRR